MNDTVRGVIVFLAILLTVGIWAPLRNQPARLPSGGVATETYFGVFTYLTLRTETKEPEYKFEWTPNYKRLGATAGLTIAFWIAIFLLVKKRKPRIAPEPV